MKKSVQIANESLNVKLDSLASAIDDICTNRMSPMPEAPPTLDSLHHDQQFQQGLQERLDKVYSKIELKLNEIQDFVCREVKESRPRLGADEGSEGCSVGEKRVNSFDTVLQKSIDSAVERSAAMLRSRITGLEAAADRRLDDIHAHISIQLSIMQRAVVDLTSLVDTLAQTQALKSSNTEVNRQ